MSSCEGDSAGHQHLDQIKALYTTLANEPHRDFGWGKGKENARSLGYAQEWLETLPDAVWESAAAVGNPFAVAAIAVGQTVVDLGFGGVPMPAWRPFWSARVDASSAWIAHQR